MPLPSSGPEVPQPLIVPSTPADLADIGRLADRIWRAHYPGILSEAQINYMLTRMYDLAVMEQELAAGLRYDRLMVGAELVGFAAFGPDKAPARLKLHKLYIAPERQRTGLGSRLLRHVEAFARHTGRSCVLLTVNKYNRTAIAAYEHNGYRILEPVTTDIGGGFVMDDYVMGKELELP